MNYLIIGGTSLFGPFLIDEISSASNNIVVTKLPGEELNIPEGYTCNIEVKELDILNKKNIEDVLEYSKPNIIFNFAVQNSVGYAWEHPDETIDVNVNGLLNLLDEVRVLDYRPRVIIAGSGEEYGELPFSSMPISENAKPKPRNIFAASKICQTMMSELYAKAYGLDIVILRTFNEIGPGQSDRFVVSSLCHQFARIEAGRQEPEIHVGNINIKRDFTDVRDLAKAFVAVSENELSHIKYNAGCGQALAIAEVIEMLTDITKLDISIKSQSDRIRPIDSAVFEANYTLLHEETGWKPERIIKDTINDMLDYWRKCERK